MKQKILVSALAAFVALIATSSAFAFECYNASRSEQGNASAAKGSLMSLEEILADPEVVGLCPAGVAHVIEGLQEEGFRTDQLISFHALMAGGLEKNGKGGDKLHNGKGIDHLGEEFFGAIDPLIGEGFGICAD